MDGKARVTAVERGHYEVDYVGTRKRAVVRGRFHEVSSAELPKVGDWVVLSEVTSDTAQIESILPRKNTVSRTLSFDDTTQVLVSNVDIIMIVMGCDNDFNIRRLERYLALVAAAEATPVIVLSKSDLVPDVLPAMIDRVQAVSGNVQALPVSTISEEGMAALTAVLTPHSTTVLLGSSGAGKSSLINLITQTGTAATGRLRTSDERGRHTTRRRQMYMLENGAAIIDTPGIRELALENTEEAAAAAYPAIEALTHECQFRNCDHDKSAGCAVQAAITSGEVAADTVAAYLKLRHRQQRHRRTRSLRR